MYGRQALREHLPWIVPESLEALKSIIQPTWRVFEWGSGGSTLYWAKNCRRVFSVEQNSDWVFWVSERLVRYSLWENVTQLYIRKDRKANTYNAYADVIKAFDDESFNLIYVDGEASVRGRCLHNALPKLKPDGYLLLDNSNWLEKDLGSDWERSDFVARGLKWIGQPGTFNWWTSILHKKLAES